MDNLGPLSVTSLWNRNKDSLFIASSLSLSRNLKNFPFPSRLATSDKKHIYQLISSQLHRKNSHLKTAEGYTLCGNDKEWIRDFFLLQEPINQLQHSEGIAIDAKAKILALINAEDHLHLYSTSPSNQLESGFNRILALENKMNRSVDFAFSNRFGFLTSNPKYCGSALKIRAFLHLPLLLNKGLPRGDQQALLYSNFQGQPYQDAEHTPSFFTGSILVLENNPALGQTEESALLSIQEQCEQFQHAETLLRNEMKNHPTCMIKNEIARHFGLLKHSWSLSHTELIDAITSMKLGIDLNLVSGHNHTLLNMILMSSGKANLKKSLPDIEDINHQRALQVQQLLKRLRLNT